MKNLNRTIKKVGLLFIAAMTTTYAQDVTTVDAASEEISENLDLEAMASVGFCPPLPRKLLPTMAMSASAVQSRISPVLSMTKHALSGLRGLL